MSARFVQLRIAGFKSFAEPISVDILPGLTGIVGPNGCGKSNVVEALRWAMGETSARSLRGGEMDDLIFAGTANRPARNLAEVTLTLENAKGLGPGAFADVDDLQVTRRAERGSGSDYRLNGKTIRGRDVQTLFADLASGARSSAMVSQGRVAMLVGARPEERRTILEEAAGITGLHARRHEAELKLRATETNLTRAEDLRTQLESRLEGLTGQSEQAARYRDISASLRESETSLLALLHARARQQVERAIEATAAARKGLIAAEEAAETSVIGDFEAGKALPALREAADAARTALERRRVAAEGVAREEERAAETARAAAERLKQSQADHDAALARHNDAQETLQRLTAEIADTEAATAALPEKQADADRATATMQTAIAEALDTLERATGEASAARARLDQAQAGLQVATVRHNRLVETRATLDSDYESLKADLPDAGSLTAQEEAIAAAIATLAAQRGALEEATQRRSDAQLALSIARNAAETARARHAERRTARDSAAARLKTLQQDRDTLARRKAETEAGLVPEEARAAFATALAEAESQRAAAGAALEAAEVERAAAGAALVEARARAQEDNTIRAAAADALRAAEAALRRAEQEAATLSRDLQVAIRDEVPDDVLSTAQTARAAEEQRLSEIEQTLEAADRAQSEATTTAREHDAALGALKAEQTRVRAQAEGLAEALKGGEEQDAGGAPVSDLLTVPDGLEAALAAALAEGLDAPEALASPNAPRNWRDLPPLAAPPPLPPEATPLAALVTAPDVLTRALSLAGLVEDADAERLASGLAAGQCLVTRAGALWRWDGLHMRAGLPSAAALRLAQRRVLREAEQRLQDLAASLPEAERLAADAVRTAQDASDAVKAARATRAAVEAALGKARSQEADVARRHGAAKARLDAVRPQHERATQAQEAARQTLAEAQQTQGALPDPAALRAAHDGARERDQRAAQAETARRTERQRAEQALDAARKRAQETEARHGSAEARLATILPELARLSDEVATAEAAIAAAESALGEAADPQAAATALQAAEAETRAADVALTEARAAAETAEASGEAARATHRATQELSLELGARISALEPRRAAMEQELLEAREALEAARRDVATSEASAVDPANVETLRERVTALRAEEQAARELRATLLAEAGSLATRVTALKASISEWTAREASTRTALNDVEARVQAASGEHATVSALPAEAQRLRESSASALAEAEAVFLAADSARDAAETRIRNAQDERRRAEAALAAAREDVLRSEGKSEQARAILDQLLAETPEPPLAPVSDLTESAETSLRRKIARLTREREDMGPVNLRADIEAQEAQTHIDTIQREHGELETAIARLRGSIGALNKEGRERLMAVFTQVDQHFQSLFSRMFGGGRAHLGLVGSDDPLQAGLEIYAQPPGKKLATLSLLSGGEQALTALSLIFAVFRCNPAPICVLDEVDAPLDDANVGRFCALLGDMASEAGTRFLVVTHHQLTMAHMDRLFGVTMQERGVSRVLSVDLERASAMAGSQTREEAHA
ncbi:AAA family ATPase [Acetobacter sacchari]|uniref:Chromosome partition protein Smc n=1 Tax=Acetobacter sacchari TaxID=2661687 RepID=A0ABS3LUR7_9PROT|nr:AAA family ATPase [Acetobacter sacchari]MBO1359655.1 AAA family ATPase [Acetobacter sacchari]